MDDDSEVQDDQQEEDWYQNGRWKKPGVQGKGPEQILW